MKRKDVLSEPSQSTHLLLEKRGGEEEKDLLDEIIVGNGHRSIRGIRNTKSRVLLSCRALTNGREEKISRKIL